MVRFWWAPRLVSMRAAGPAPPAAPARRWLVDGSAGSSTGRQRTVKPVLYGYQTVRAGTPAVEIDRGREALAAFAQREGFALGEIFVERDANHPSSALTAL